MRNMLKQKLWTFIIQNNPDVALDLQENNSVLQYLEEKVNAIIPISTQMLGEGKPLYVIEEICLGAMTEELRPSRFQYICSIIEEEFSSDFERMIKNGTLTYEIVNLIEACKGIFNDFDFNSENEADRHLRYAIIGQVNEYLG